MVPSAMYDITTSPRQGYHLPHRSPPTPPNRQQQQQQQQQMFAANTASPSSDSNYQSHQHNHQRMQTPGSVYPQTRTLPSSHQVAPKTDSRVYGRTKDLRKLADFRLSSADNDERVAANNNNNNNSSPGGLFSASTAPSTSAMTGTPSSQSGGASSASAFGLGGKSKGEPIFSVEVYAPAFDERGYPIFAGQAATISATVRMNPALNADIEVTTYAYTTAGSSAAVWDGLILLPSASSTDKNTVFSVKDYFEPSSLGQLHIRSPTVGPPENPSSPPLGGGGSQGTKGTPLQDEYILTVPVSWRLPLGAGKAVIDGQAQSVSVALPPSFELTRADEPDSPLIGASGAGGLASSGSSASIYRSSPPGSSAGGRGGPAGGGEGGPGSVMGLTTLGAPTITTVTPKKSKAARTLKGVVEKTLESVTRLGCFYVIEFALVTKGSGGPAAAAAVAANGSSANVDKTSKKGQQGDKAGAAKDRVLDVISIPFIFAGESTSAPLPPQALPPTLRPQMLTFNESMILAQGWQKHHVQTKWTGMMLKALRRGIQLELHLPNATAFHAPSVVPFLIIIRPTDASLLPPAPQTPPEQQDWRSLAGSGGRGSSIRRPATAPTVITSGSPSGSSVITRTTAATSASSRVDLTRVVRVSLVQVVYSNTSSVNDLPVRKRRIMSTAIEVEEVDLGAFLAEDASTNDEKVVGEAQRAGVRVLAGKLRVSPYVTPSFRSQGIEVKYGIKVDLIPFGTSKEGRGGGGDGGVGSSGASIAGLGVGGSGSSVAGGLGSSSRSIKESTSSSASGVGGTITSAMKSLRLKTSTSRFGSSYASSIFSSKSRRARGFSDGTAVDQPDWNATASMPAGGGTSTLTNAQAQALQQQQQRQQQQQQQSQPRSRINTTGFAATSPPPTPPWNGNEAGSNVAGASSPTGASASRQYLSSTTSPSQMPRSVSEGTGLGHSQYGSGGNGNGVGVGASATSSASSSNASTPGLTAQQINGGVASANSHSDDSVDPSATASAYDASAGQNGGANAPGGGGYGWPSAAQTPTMPNGAARFATNAAGSSSSPGASATAGNSVPGSPAYGSQTSPYHPYSHNQHGNTLPFVMNSDVAQLVASSAPGAGGGANGAAGTGTGLASPLIGGGGGTGAPSQAGTSYAPSSWAPSSVSQFSRWQAAAAAAAAGGAGYNGTGGAPASTISPTMYAADIESEHKKLAKLQKTVGALWVDVRIVRGADAPVAPAPHSGVLMNALVGPHAPLQ
ncbi:hypothetical protein V8E36_002757 [Tilletia maclaganii]